MKSIRNRSRQERDGVTGRKAAHRSRERSEANRREIKEMAQRECPHEVLLDLPPILRLATWEMRLSRCLPAIGLTFGFNSIALRKSVTDKEVE